MSRRNHVLDQLVQGMREALEDSVTSIRELFSDEPPMRGKEPRISPRQELAIFLGMPPEEKQRVAMEMGPEAYNQYVIDMYNRLYQMVGPVAGQVLPELISPIEDAAQQPIDRDTLEADLLNLLGEFEKD